MADRAERPDDDDPYAGIVDLNKDDRWQARLAEARARREQALREKGGEPRRRSKPKPWETEAGEDPDDFFVEPVIQAKEPDDDKVDFADRVDVMREAVSKPSPKPSEPVARARGRDRPISKPSRSNDIFDDLDEPSVAPRVTSTPREEARLVVEGSPGVAELAAKYAASRALASKVEAAEEEDSGTAAAPEEDEAPVTLVKRVRQRPTGLAIVLLGLALLPFATMPPPLEKGPPFVPVSPFGVVPALGLTTAMLWRPVETVSGEWKPPAVLPPDGPLEVVPLPPVEHLGHPGGPAVLTPGEDGIGRLVFPDVGDLRPTMPELRGSFPGAPEGGQAVLIEAGLPSVKPRPRPERLGDQAALSVDPASVGADAAEAAEIEIAGIRPVPKVRGESRVADLGGVSLVADVQKADFPLKVTVLVPSSDQGALADAMAAQIAEFGHDLARIKRIDLSISSRNVRYFHDEDRAEAARLAATFGASLKDFSWFRPSPEEGTVEVWLEGKGS